MKSIAVSAGQTATAAQYNNLRQDAYASSMLLAHEQSTPDLTLKVEAGEIYFGSTLVSYAGGNSPTFTAPSANPRIDVLSFGSTISSTTAITLEQITQNGESSGFTDSTSSFRQSFYVPSTIHSITVSALKLKLRASSSGSYALTVRVGVGTTSALTNVLSTIDISGTGMTTSAGSSTDITATLPTSLTLFGGGYYWFEVYRTSGTNTYYTRKQSGNPIDGQLFIGSTEDSNNDAYFQFTVTNTYQSSNALIRTAGVEAASPTAPIIPDGHVPICQVYNRVGQTTIRDTDTTGQGYILKNARQAIAPRDAIFLKATSATTRGDIVMFANTDSRAYEYATTITTADTINSGSSKYRAQTFVAPAGVNRLTRAGLYVVRSGTAASGTATIKVFATSGGSPTGAALATIISQAPNSFDTGGALSYITATLNLQVTPGNTYAIVFDCSSVTFSTSSLSPYYGASQTTNNGQRLTSTDGTTWTADSANDLVFLAEFDYQQGAIVPYSTSLKPNGAGLLQSQATLSAGDYGYFKRLAGILDGFSNLVIGERYYTSSIAGAVSTSNAGQRVGRAISPTQILAGIEKNGSTITTITPGSFVINENGYLVVNMVTKSAGQSATITKYLNKIPWGSTILVFSTKDSTYESPDTNSGSLVVPVTAGDYVTFSTNYDSYVAYYERL